MLLKFCIFLATLVIDVEPPKGSGRPLVLIGLERCAVSDVFGKVAPLFVFLVLLLEELFDNLNRLEETVEDVFEGVPVSLFLEEW